jgi:glycosyltransferase involved in cell wall biosynthesis
LAPVSVSRVTVVCIFYEAERFISEAIESVLAQDYHDWELVLVDDGSTDAGTAIARQYASSSGGRIRYVEHPGHANRGMSASRNRGLAEATGDFVAFIDADDCWRPQKLARQVALLDAQPGLGMVCGTVNYWQSWLGGTDRLVPTGLPGKVLHPPIAATTLYPLGWAHAPCPSDVMLLRSLVERVGGFEERFTGFYEDQAFFAKIYLAASVKFSHEVWLDYRQHSDSSMSQTFRSGGYVHARLSFLDWLEAFVGRSPDDRRKLARAISRARWRLRHPRIGRLWALVERLRAGV